MFKRKKVKNKEESKSIEIGNGVHLKNEKLYFDTYEYNTLYGRVYNDLDAELLQIIYCGSATNRYNPQANLAGYLVKWNLDLTYEQIIIHRFKELLKLERKKEKTEKQKFNEKLKLIK